MEWLFAMQVFLFTFLMGLCRGYLMVTMGFPTIPWTSCQLICQQSCVCWVCGKRDDYVCRTIAEKGLSLARATDEEIKNKSVIHFANKDEEIKNKSVIHFANNVHDPVVKNWTSFRKV
jgi:hypothetical protein